MHSHPYSSNPCLPEREAVRLFSYLGSRVPVDGIGKGASMRRSFCGLLSEASGTNFGADNAQLVIRI